MQFNLLSNPKNVKGWVGFLPAICDEDLGLHQFYLSLAFTLMLSQKLLEDSTLAVG